MDYVFFAFSALCLGFAVLLISLLADRQGRPLRLPFLLLAIVAALLYYSLEVSLFSRQQTLYVLANVIPQGLLLICLAIYLWLHGRKA